MGIFSRRMAESRKTVSSQSFPPRNAAVSPTQAVLNAIAAGESSRLRIAEMTGLRRETVDVIIAKMERAGQLRREAMGGLCPGGGCSSCGHASADGQACSSSSSRGPVALVLQKRPHPPML